MSSDSGDLGAAIDSHLRPLEAIEDPLCRYREAVAAESLHRAALRRLVDVRALSALELHERGSSYGRIADSVGLTRARAQQLVQRGRVVQGLLDGPASRPAGSANHPTIQDHGRLGP
jgi:hypothetical protein